MIYATKERAQEIAKMLNGIQGYGRSIAARVAEGWIVTRVSPYSQGDILEYAQ